jgi:signal transduction histidine kinase
MGKPMREQVANPEDAVLILAPTGRDAQLIGSALEQSAYAATVCGDVGQMCAQMKKAGTCVIAEEALSLIGLEVLSDALSKQPPWSDFPLIVLTQEGPERADANWHMLALVESLGNVTLLERPVHQITLVSAVRVALRARRKQYQVRDYLQAREVAEEALKESEIKLRNQAHELDERVRQRTSELLHANQELEGFTYSIAHDLRSPLRRLMFTSRMIQNDYNETLDLEGKEALGELAGEARKLSILVDDLLQYARLGQQPVSATTVDVSQLTSEVVATMKPDPRVKFCIEPSIVVHADPGLLELVLCNLLDNACKYAASVEQPIVWIGYDPGLRAIFVKDNGIGFEMQFAAKIFKPFERLHRDAEYPGTGIGLANVKRIVERHGGRVWTDSAPGQGATFYFTLGHQH